MKNKKIKKQISTLLIAGMMLASATTAFAANGDIYTKSGKLFVEYGEEGFGYIDNWDQLEEAVIDAENYKYEFGNNVYDLNTVAEKTENLTGNEFNDKLVEVSEDATIDSTPVDEFVKDEEEPPVDELKIESVSAIDATTISVTFSDETVVEFTVEEMTEGENTVTFTHNEVEYTEVVVYEAPVVDELTVESVSAINSTQAEVTFSKEVKEVKPANFKVTDKDGNLVFVSKIELNEAKTAATLTFFSKFADKATYTVETSNVADVDGNVMTADTDAFTYLAAKVAKVEFTSTTIAPSTDLRTIVKVTDELGRDVTSEQSIDFESSNPVSVGADGKATSTPGSAIVVAKVGDVKTAPTTIKVSAKVATAFTGFNVYTGSNTVADTDAFEKLEADKKVEYVYADDTSSKLALYYKDQYGKSITAVDSGLSVTNMTPSVVIVNADGTITPISAGEGYVKVKANADLEHTIKIVVREKAEVATMELEKTDVSVVEGQNATVKVTFKDQFNTKVSKTPTVKSAATATATSVAGTDSVVVNGVKEGTTTVDVTYKVGETTLKQTINVTVVKAADLATYQAEVAATKLDVDGNDADSTKLPTFTNVVVNEIDANGNKIGTTAATLKEVDKDGKDLAAGKDLVTIAGQKVTAKAAGTAYVQVKVGSLVIDTLEFEVVKTASYAKTVAFDRNDIVKKSPELGTLASANKVTIDDTLLTSIVKAKDQYGKVMVSQPTLEFTFNVTNKTDLTIDNSNDVTELNKATGTADIVITKINVNGQTENLISAPVVVKLSVQADEALAVAALNEASATEGNYKAAGITGVTSGNLSAMNTAVGAAKVTKDSALTKVEIQDVVNNVADVDEIKTLLEGTTYTVAQADANTEATAKAKVEAIIAALDLKGVDATVTPIVSTPFQEAVAGASGSTSGTDGFYKFTVELAKGTATTLIEDETSEQKLTIEATEYVAP